MAYHVSVRGGTDKDVRVNLANGTVAGKSISIHKMPAINYIGDQRGSILRRKKRWTLKNIRKKLIGVDSFNSLVEQISYNTSNTLSFTEASMVLFSPKGITAMTIDNIYQYAQQNRLLNRKQDTNIAANPSLRASVGY